jgi:hypothetical protein
MQSVNGIRLLKLSNIHVRLCYNVRYDVTFSIMDGTPAAYWVGGGRDTGSDFGPEIDYTDGHSSSSSSVTPDKCRDKTLNEATTAALHSTPSDTVQ